VGLSFDALSARTQGAVFILLSIALVAGVWRGWLAPERLLLESRRLKLTSSITELARLRLTIDGLPGLQRDVRTLEAKLASMRPAERDSGSEEQILEMLGDLATRSGVEIAAFAAPAADGKDPKQRRLQLAIEGSFDGTVTFLDGLLSLGRIGSITEFAIKPQTKAGGRGGVAATIVADVRADAAPVAVPEAPEDAASPDGRDPFVDPGLSTSAADVGRGATGQPPPGGLAGLSVDDVSVTGIVRAGDRMTAVLQGANRQTFVARPLDRLLDATVTSIDEAGVVFVKNSSGSVSRKKEPEVVRKNLKKTQGAVR
jgi:Tfp pilus assembly protein PilO